MSNVILLLGEPKTGKTYSIRNLPDKETVVLNNTFKKSDAIGKKHEVKKLHNILGIKKRLKQINDTPAIKYLIVDDFNYCIGEKFMTRANERGYEKFTDLALELHSLFTPTYLRNLRDDLWVIFISHVDFDKERNRYKMKIQGQMVENHFNIEGLYENVFFSIVEGEDDDVEYSFICKPNKVYPSCNQGNLNYKEPNDLKHIIDKLCEKSK